MNSEDNIKFYIPQREPFIMIDALTASSEQSFSTRFTIAENNLFLEDNTLREYALIENIAQTFALGLSKQESERGSTPADGFIGNISKLTVHELPKTGDTIETTASVLYRFGNMFLIKGESYLNGNLLMDCEMKLAGMAREN